MAYQVDPSLSSPCFLSSPQVEDAQGEVEGIVVMEQVVDKEAPAEAVSTEAVSTEAVSTEAVSTETEAAEVVAEAVQEVAESLQADATDAVVERRELEEPQA